MTKPTTTGSDNSEDTDLAKMAVEQADKEWDDDESDDSQESVKEPETTEGQTADDDDSDNLEASTEESETTEDDDEADEKAENESEEGEDSEEETPITFDKDLDKWIEKRLGRKPESDQERRDYQELRNSQRAFTRSKQTNDLDKALNESAPESSKQKADPNDLEAKFTSLQKELEAERNLRIRGEFLLSNNVTDDEIKAMGDVLRQKLDFTPQEERQAVYNFLTSPHNLKSLHSEAKASLVNSESKQAEIEKAKKEERQRVAKTSQASPAARSAKTRVLEKEKTAEDKLNELWDDDKDW